MVALRRLSSEACPDAAGWHLTGAMCDLLSLHDISAPSPSFLVQRVTPSLTAEHVLNQGMLLLSFSSKTIIAC